MSNATTTTAAPFGPPTTVDIVVPPVVCVVVSILGLLVFSIISQHRWWKSRLCGCKNKLEPDGGDPKLFVKINNDHSTFFNREDQIIMMKFLEYQNNPISLMIVSLPFMVSLAFCPITIFLHAPLVQFFWPKEFVAEVPKINDVIAAFLMPAGLVYAVSFGFAFQDVMSKKDSVDKCFENMRNLVRQMWEMMKGCSSIPKEQKLMLCRNLKGCVVDWMKRLIGYKSKQDFDTPWTIIATLQQTKTNSNSGTCDGTLIDQIVSHSIELDSILRSDCLKGRTGITILQWIFLEIVGFISFFGILLVKADSYRIELTMCILTVLSISAFSYILADLDTPYHGTVRVDLSICLEDLKEMSKDHDDMMSGNNGPSVKLNGI